MGARIALATLFSVVLLSSCSSPSDVRPDQCHPCTVSAKVGPLLKEAQAMYQAGNYQGALAKLDEAEALKVYADDTTVITAMRQAVAVRAGDVSLGGAAAAKAKFADDYNAGKWRDVIADADMLEKAGALGAQEQLVIGQAYFKAGDYAGCVKYTETLNSDVAHELQARCAFEVAKAPRP